jgi:hypothetical protein
VISTWIAAGCSLYLQPPFTKRRFALHVQKSLVCFDFRVDCSSSSLGGVTNSSTRPSLTLTGTNLSLRPDEVYDKVTQDISIRTPASIFDPTQSTFDIMLVSIDPIAWNTSIMLFIVFVSRCLCAPMMALFHVIAEHGTKDLTQHWYMPMNCFALMLPISSVTTSKSLYLDLCANRKCDSNGSSKFVLVIHRLISKVTQYIRCISILYCWLQVLSNAARTSLLAG